MAPRKKAKKAEPSKRRSILAPLRTACLSSVSLDTLALVMPPPRRAPRDSVHYYSDGKRHVVDLETSHGL
jgi:hypothetical protein